MSEGLGNRVCNADVALKCGVCAGFVYNYFAFWCEHNKDKANHQHDGKAWMYATYDDIADYLPMFCRNTIIAAVKKLVADGYVGEGNFNAKAYDKTKWFCVYKKLVDGAEKASTKICKSVYQKLVDGTEKASTKNCVTVYQKLVDQYQSGTTGGTPVPNKQTSKQCMVGKVEGGTTVGKYDLTKMPTESVFVGLLKRKNLSDAVFGRVLDVYRRNAAAWQIKNWGKFFAKVIADETAAYEKQVAEEDAAIKYADRLNADDDAAEEAAIQRVDAIPTPKENPIRVRAFMSAIRETGGKLPSAWVRASRSMLGEEEAYRAEA